MDYMICDEAGEALFPNIKDFELYLNQQWDRYSIVSIAPVSPKTAPDSFIPSPNRRSRARWLREQDAKLYTPKYQPPRAQLEVSQLSFQQPVDLVQPQTEPQTTISHEWSIYFDNRAREEHNSLIGHFFTGGIAISFEGGWKDVLAFAVRVRNNISAERNLIFINEDVAYDLPPNSTDHSLEEAIQSSIFKEW